MNTYTEQEQRPRKGRPPQGNRHVNIMLPFDLAEWAKDSEEGLSGMTRRLLAEERRRREVQQAQQAS